MFSLLFIFLHSLCYHIFLLAQFQGKISARDILNVAKEVGEHFTNEEIMEMIEEADSNGESPFIVYW